MEKYEGNMEKCARNMKRMNVQEGKSKKKAVGLVNFRALPYIWVGVLGKFPKISELSPIITWAVGLGKFI